MGNEIQCDKLINRFLLRGRKFVEHSCFRYGLYRFMVQEEITFGYIDDFQFFVFTKSIKSLCSIRELLKLGHVEDALILLRTTFEGYIASRYIAEEYDLKLFKDFIFIPQQIAARMVIFQEGKATMRGTKEIIDYIQRNPSDMKLGKDKRYFSDFYAFLCNYAHCNFSIIDCYTDGVQFSCDKSDNRYLAKVLTLFVYTKLFENIVTVKGEDYYNLREEKECYRLVRDATLFVYERLGELVYYDCKTTTNELNKHMQKMFKSMQVSLKEEIGSVKKDFLN